MNPRSLSSSHSHPPPATPPPAPAPLDLAMRTTRRNIAMSTLTGLVCGLWFLHILMGDPRVMVENQPRGDSLLPTQIVASSDHGGVALQTELDASEVDVKYRKPKQSDEELKYYTKSSNIVNRIPGFLKNVTACADDTILVIVVHSLHNEYDRRMAIRDTWGRHQQESNRHMTWPGTDGQQDPQVHNFLRNTRIVFMLGVHWSAAMEEALIEEHVTHGDVIQANFLDTYRNLTLKSLMSLRWITESCSNAQYAMKCDDDTMVNIPFIQHLIQPSSVQGAPPFNASSTVIGARSSGGEVYRNGKWQVHTWQYPFTRYPDYLSGPAYMFSLALAARLYDTAHYVPIIFIEDVYITGILSRVLHLNIHHVSRFAYTNSPPPTACQVLRGDVFTATNINATYLRVLWDDMSMRTGCHK